MIDWEVKIFNRFRAAVAPLCAKGKVTSVQVISATDLPAVNLIEMDNRTVREMQTNSPTENFAILVYQLDVYAGSKSECRKVFAAADEAMLGMNFNRFSGTYIDNPTNTSVFRYTARYEAIADREGNLYRRR